MSRPLADGDVDSGPGLGRAAAKGTLWLGLVNVASKGALVVVTLVLATIFQAEELGLISLTFAIINLAQLIQSMGVYDVIARTDADPQRFAGTVATLSVAAAGLIAVVGIAFAHPLAQVLGAPMAVPLLRVAFISMPFTAYGGVQLALMHRNLDFRKRLLPDAGSSLIGSATIVVLAYAGFGPMAAVWGVLLQAVLLPVLAAARRVYVVPRFSRDAARETLHWAAVVGPATLLGVALQNVDYPLVTHLLGSAATGVYSLAYRIAFAPYLLIAVVLGAVAFPVYAQLRRQAGDHSLPEVVARFLGVTAAAALGANSIIAGMGRYIALLGDQWVPGVSTLWVLCVYCVAMCLTFTLLTAMRAVGLLRIFLASQAIQLVLVILLIFALTPTLGILGTAAAQAAASLLVLALVCWWTPKSLHLSLRQIAHALRGPLVAAIAVLATATAFNLTWPGTGADLLIAVGEGCTLTAVYLLVLWLADRPLATAALHLLHRKDRT